MKVVLDTNVIIAAFATQGLCYLVFENVVANHEMIVSPELLKEVQDNLHKKLKLPPARTKELLTFLTTHAKSIQDSPVAGLKCRDSDDLKILALAVNSQAEALVTGDQDLLVLQSVGTAAILSPRDFWNMLRTS